MENRFMNLNSSEASSENWEELNQGFNNVAAELDAVTGSTEVIQAEITGHIGSVAAHAAEHITYDGSVAGASNLKEAVDIQKQVVQGLVEDISVNINNYGAVGDGKSHPLSGQFATLQAARLQYPHATSLTDELDWAAVQSAIYAAEGRRKILIPEGIFLMSNPLTIPDGQSIYLEGNNIDESVLKATEAFTGYILRFKEGINITNLTFTGNGKDGTFLIGANSGGHGGVYLNNLKFYNAEYAAKFDGTMQFPVRGNISNIWVYGMRTAGFKIAGPNTDGQSCLQIDNYVANGFGSPGISAGGIVVTPNATETSDRLVWSGSNAKEYGWTIMRRVVNDTDHRNWEFVERVSSTVTEYTAAKKAGAVYNYVVVRTTAGMHIRYLKGVTYGTIQSEYFGYGLLLDDTVAHTINNFYYEWRGVFDSPIPKGSAIVARNGSSLTVLNGWAEGAVSMVEALNNQYSIIGGVANNCQRSGVHIDAYSPTVHVNTERVIKAGSTPQKITRSSTIYSHNTTSLNPDNGDNERNEFSLNHPYESRYSLKYRGAEMASIGATSTGGYVRTNALEVKMNTSELTVPLQGQIPRKNLKNNVDTDVLTFKVSDNSAGMLTFDFMIKIVDASSVARQVSAGRMMVTHLVTSSTTFFAEATVTGLSKIIQNGTLADPVFTTSIAGNVVTVKCRVNATSMSPHTIQFTLIPVTKLGEQTNIVS